MQRTPLRKSRALTATVCASLSCSVLHAQTVLFTHGGAAHLNEFGATVAGPGDLDGDGVPDFAIGSPGADFGGSNAGRVTAFSGSDGSELFHFDGTAGHRVGESLDAAGDVDGDGHADIIVAAFFDDANGNDSGTVTLR